MNDTRPALLNSDTSDEAAAGLLGTGKVTPDDFVAWIRSKNGSSKKPGLYCKVSQKQALSVYGLQRMPVTLYAGQWERLLDFAEHIREFITANESSLARK